MPSYNSSKSPKRVNYTYNVTEPFLHFICTGTLKALKFSAPSLRKYSKGEKNIKTFDIRDGTRSVQAHIQRKQGEN
jgi:hypothetical protein